MKPEQKLSTNIHIWRAKTKQLLTIISKYNAKITPSADYLDYEAKGYSHKSKLGFINSHVDTAWDQLSYALTNLDKALAVALIEEIDNATE